MEAAEKLYDLLAMPCKDEAAPYGRTAENRHGLEAWQALWRVKTRRHPMNLTNQLLHPHVSSSDPRVVTCVSGKVRKWIQSISRREAFRAVKTTREHLWTCEIAAISAEREEYCEAFLEEFNREATDPGFVAPVVGC